MPNIRELENAVAEAVDRHLATLRQSLLTELTTTLGGGSSSASLSAALYRVLAAGSQTEILQGLLDSSAAFAERAAILVVRGERLTGWRARGFDGPATERLRQLSLEPAGDGWKKALAEQSATPVIVEPLPEALAHTLFAATGTPSDERGYFLPLQVKDRPVAVLYADGGSTSSSLDLPALDILTRLTGMYLEISAARPRTAVAAAPSSVIAEAASAEAPVAEAAAAVEAPVEMPAAEPPPAEPLPVEPPPAVEIAEPPPPPAIEPEPAPEPPPPVTAPAAPRFSLSGPDLSSVPEGEHDIHKKAFRAAKVMVDELILYNKGKIESARESSSVYSTLRDDIDKCRQTYMKRFGSTPAGKVDYFHLHLLSRIANGDPALLGTDYPGPLV